MPYAVTDLRPFKRNMRVGWQTFQTIFANFWNIFSSFSVEHDFATGRHQGGQFAAAGGRYVFDGTKYTIVKGYGPVPDTITPSSTGVFKFEFLAALDSANYGIKLTAESDTSKAATINYIQSTVTAAGFDVNIRNGGTDSSLVNRGFSVEITMY